MRCSFKAREKPKAIHKDKKARTKIHCLPIGQQEMENRRPSVRQRKDKKGKAIPQKRQASLNLMPMKANGLNLPISHLMIPGKPTVPHGTGLQKLTGKKLKVTTKNGRRLRTGNPHQAGLPLSYTKRTQEKTS